MKLRGGDDKKNTRCGTCDGGGVGSGGTEQGSVTKPTIFAQHDGQSILAHSAHMPIDNQVKLIRSRPCRDDDRVVGMLFHNKQCSQTGKFWPGLLPIDRLKQRYQGQTFSRALGNHGLKTDMDDGRQ
jgi:hypothetical protein